MVAVVSDHLDTAHSGAGVWKFCCGQGIKWTSHFCLMLKVTIHEALPFLPHTSSGYVV